MAFDEKILASLTRRVEPSAYLRCTPIAHRATPLGMGYGKTRFASPDDRFKLLYIAEDCGFRRKPAGDSDLMSATIPI
ncbi:hypothetical protein [Novosphingobium mathurense]|uniref:Uncharacterized protein n=1 Tax=Novosphingobium mathurense TaxID=428990 RepID=A0A1U6IZ43_9SPHN|nr:hypothetical protein [Novosphingobium mathurense]SLK13268.1 hypothetical protein SAMN06295987_12610 [Novosphingobium mathurense]